MNNMENEQEELSVEPIEENKPKAPDSGKNILIGCSMIAVALIIFSGVQLYIAKRAPATANNAPQANESANALQEEVLPSQGITLPVKWNDLGKQMVATGVINETQFDALYTSSGGLSSGEKALLDSSGNGDLVITSENSGIILNLLWALGLSNQNPILGSGGDMENPQYGGAANFASTGGWTLAVGSAMSHYDAHSFVTLTADQQSLVESVAKNIYRPCCGNSTYFPDCNHGMAMLGLLELMASQGATESQMYKAALAVNSYWFPDNYMTLAQYFANKGVDWNAVDPKEVLSAAYSSAQGYQSIVSQISAPSTGRSQGGCAV
jgi:hypothetical protein